MKIVGLGGTSDPLGTIIRSAEDNPFSQLDESLPVVRETYAAAGIFGKEFVLKVDVFVENRAIKDYGTFLNRVKFDEDTVNLINRIIADEVFHKDTWKSSIEELTSQEA